MKANPFGFTPEGTEDKINEAMSKLSQVEITKCSLRDVFTAMIRLELADGYTTLEEIQKDFNRVVKRFKDI